MRFWLKHAFIPLFVFIFVIWVFETYSLDITIAKLFFNADSNKWYFGESWWSVTFIHKWGRDFIALIMLCALLGLISSLFMSGLRPYRFALFYVIAVILLSTGVVSEVKHLTNIDCPWDLSLFNGTQPYFHIFADKSDKLVKGSCFPGGHSSGGFSLLLFYFLLRDYNRRYAYIALGTAIFVGSVFGFGQWVRGAHFVSHDLWSAMIAWFSALFLYKLFYQSRAIRQADK